jgi:uncharacterized secreted repeat protein (TIGR03808 family)
MNAPEHIGAFMAIDRRSALGLSAGGAAGALLPSPARATPQPLGSLGLDITHFGVSPGAAEDQTAALQRAIDASAEARVPLWLPAGNYVAADLMLPSGAQLYGVRGATRIVLGHGASIMASLRADRVTLQNVIFDGRRAFLPKGRGLITLKETRGCRVLDCLVQESGGDGIALIGVEGEIAHTTVIGAEGSAMRAIDARGLLVAHNTIAHCAQDGIVVERSTSGYDGTQILANRIEKIAVAGAAGEHGNGIVVRGCANVIVADNQIRECAGSAVHAANAAELQVRGNSISRCGGVAINASMNIDGVVIASNTINSAAGGISLAAGDQRARLAAVQGNLMRNLRGSGVAGAATDATIAGNVIERIGGH